MAKKLFSAQTGAGVPVNPVISNNNSTPTITTGLIAGLPAFGNTGAFYIATDTRQLLTDTGTAWVVVGLFVDTSLFPLLVGTNVFNGSNTFNGTGVQVNTHFDATGVAEFDNTMQLTNGNTFFFFDDMGTNWQLSSDSSVPGFTIGSPGQPQFQFKNAGVIRRSSDGGQVVWSTTLPPAVTLVASNKVTGSMASGNLITYAQPLLTDNVYRISFYYLVRTGTGTANITITYTNEVSTVVTYVSPSISNDLGSNAFPVVINVLQGTNIVIDSVITGTAICDFYTAIEDLF